MSHPHDIHARETDTIDLHAYVRPIWRWKWVIALIVAVAAAGTYFLSSRQPKHYVASSSVYIKVADPAAAVESTQPPAAPTAQNMQDLATLFTAQTITTAVYRQLRVPAGSAGSVTVTPLVGQNATSTSFLVVTATSGSPTLAARLANTYVEAFLTSRRKAQAAQAASDVTATQQALASLTDVPANFAERQVMLTQLAQLRTIALNPSDGAQQTNIATAPMSPSSPKPVRDAILGALVGLLLGVGAAFGLELFDRRLVRMATVESVYSMPVLAALPHVRDPTPMHDGRAVIPSAFVEPIRSLRINVGMAVGQGRRRTLLVTSGIPGEGKSTVVRDLALVYAEAGEAVLVIDADLRRPSIARLFGVETQVGLVQVLRSEVQLTRAVVRVYGAGPVGARQNGSNGATPLRAARSRGSIDLLGYGEQVANPVAFLGSGAMRSTLMAAAQTYDLVILDTAPLLVVADTVPVLEMVDAVLFVARLGLTTRDSADRLVSLTERLPKANIAGVVMNDLRGASFGNGYGTYGYGYDAGSRAPASARIPATTP